MALFFEDERTSGYMNEYDTTLAHNRREICRIGMVGSFVTRERELFQRRSESLFTTSISHFLGRARYFPFLSFLRAPMTLTSATSLQTSVQNVIDEIIVTRDLLMNPQSKYSWIHGDFCDLDYNPKSMTKDLSVQRPHCPLSLP